MAVPKKKISKMRSRTRRSHYKVQGPGLATCTNCKTFIQPHRACSLCGHFKGKRVMNIE